MVSAKFQKARGASKFWLTNGFYIILMSFPYLSGLYGLIPSVFWGMWDRRLVAVTALQNVRREYLTFCLNR